MKRSPFNKNDKPMFRQGTERTGSKPFFGFRPPKTSAVTAQIPKQQSVDHVQGQPASFSLDTRSTRKSNDQSKKVK